MTQQADVLIIGAGPAGAAAAIGLARGGARVRLADRAPAFPRDKVCGDALIPDALAVLGDLGLSGSVAACARMLRGVRIYAPNQRAVSIDGSCACIPRRQFDDLLLAAAVASGARFEPGLRAERPLLSHGDRGTTVGAEFSAADGRRVTVRAPITLLATGAAAEPLKRFGVCERIAPSATAARIYVEADEVDADVADYLCISYDRTICPGYGWIFPGPNGVFNVGVGDFDDAPHRPPERNLRRLLDRFLNSFPPAQALMRRARPLTPLKGAPLRTTLAGATPTAPGLLVIGEAVGTTYAFSGEGIGKAMASGLLAARAILDARDPNEAAVHYETMLRGPFGSRFAAYRRAQDWLASPRLANLLAWRARRSRFVRAQLEGMFQETSDPRELFSISGLVRALVS